MKAPALSTQGILAILTMIGAFGLLGVYVLRQETPDATVTGLIALPLGAVVGFYFGHSNGTTSALASAATTLANQVTASQTASDLASIRTIGPTGPAGATGATGATGAPGPAAPPGGTP